jgi:hypothetical protein
VQIRPGDKQHGLAHTSARPYGAFRSAGSAYEIFLLQRVRKADSPAA